MFCPANHVCIPKAEFKPFKEDLAVSCAHACVLCVCVCVCKSCSPAHTHTHRAWMPFTFCESMFTSQMSRLTVYLKEGEVTLVGLKAT